MESGFEELKHPQDVLKQGESVYLLCLSEKKPKVIERNKDNNLCRAQGPGL